MLRARTLVVLAALCAPSACGGILGPTQSDLESAVRGFYARGEHPGAPDLANATISDYEGCQPRNGIFTCPVVFSTERGNVATMMWVVRGPDGAWEVRNIERNERTH